MERSQHSDDVTVFTLWEESAALHGSRVAVWDRGRHFDYTALRGEVDKIASALAALDCGARSRICLVPSHGIELVAVVLAVLKIGATYVPLDARHPRARLAHIVRDSGARLVVHSREHAQVAADLGLPRVCLDELRLGHEAGLLRPDRSRRPRSEDLAYILYTVHRKAWE